MFLSSVDSFKILFFSLKNPFRNDNRMSNSLNPDKARRFVGPHLDPNCLQMISADSSSRQRVFVDSWRRSREQRNVLLD